MATDDYQHSFSRRKMVLAGVQFAALALAGMPVVRGRPAWAAPVPGEQPTVIDRRLIVNADDFGMCEATDDGIFDAHEHGIVSSASLLVNAPHAVEAVRAAARYPNLGLGLHADFPRSSGWAFNPRNLPALRRELEHQFDTFERLVGRPPDHLDSHHHLHRAFNVGRLFVKVGARHGVAVRGFSDVTFVGSFYGVLDGKMALSQISVDYLISLIQGLAHGVTELSCHPGRAGRIPDSLYATERAVELATLTDPRVREVLQDESIELINYREYNRLAAPQIG